MPARRAEEIPTAHDVVQLASLLARAAHRLTCQLSRVLEEERCTIPGWRTLDHLARGGAESMRGIAHVTMLLPATSTRLIDRMAADDLVHRAADPQDRRRVVIDLTVRGRALHGRLVSRLARDLGDILPDLDGDDVQALAVLLRSVAGGK